jgi:ribosomal protein S18 acetylase RimI-like enzyme
MNTSRVSRLTESDWRAFAELRLQALYDSLGPHDPQFHQESSFTAAQWRRRLRAHAQFAALVDDRPVGLIGAQREHADSVYLYSLWLEPGARGQGLGQLLVSVAVDWARAQRVRTVTLRVNATNTAARGVYEALGFGLAPSVGDEDSSPTAELTMSLSVG